MKLHYQGKYNGNPVSLPHGDHHPSAVPFKEAESTRRLAVMASAAAVVILALLMVILILRGGFGVFKGLLPGAVLSLLVLFPHELLHAICFKGDVYLYTNLKEGMLFVTGPETMSKKRFIFMSLLPNIVFGAVPYVAGLAFPHLSAFGMMGALSLSMGAGDYYNVYNAATQMPKGSRTYLHGFHSYWYQ